MLPDVSSSCPFSYYCGKIIERDGLNSMSQVERASFYKDLGKICTVRRKAAKNCRGENDNCVLLPDSWGHLNEVNRRELNIAILPLDYSKKEREVMERKLRGLE
jgi:hypothetical protein